MAALSLHEAVFRYLDAIAAEGAALDTVRQYRSVLLRLSAQLPGRQLAGITTQDLAASMYGASGISAGRAPATASSHRAAIRGLFTCAHTMGWITRPVAVPAPVLRTRKTNGGESMPTRLSVPQLKLLLERSRDEPILHGMLLVACHTALRISDVSKIRLGDLDLQTGTLYLRVKKTGVPDAFPITADLTDGLHGYLRWYTRETGVTLADHTAYLFPGWRRCFPLAQGGFHYQADPRLHAQYDWANTRLREAFRRCGIQVEPREAWHVIRRSVARAYFDQLRTELSTDHALRQTAALLHHKSTATTEKYLGWTAEIAARDESLRGRRWLNQDSAGVTVIDTRDGTNGARNAPRRVFDPSTVNTAWR